MTAQPLLDLLLPAYAPCQHFSGACANFCRWAPEKGLAPGGFGGAIELVSDVKLVIVTAEPGDPPDDVNHPVNSIDMVHNSLRLFTEAMERGHIKKAGPTPFHRNLLSILDYFFPHQNLNQKLKQTWTTNTVLCPARVSGGVHPKIVEMTCTTTYLAPQLTLLRNAFILVLGNKAANRLSAAGLRFDAVGRHPSARVSNNDKHKSWQLAAEKFLNHSQN